MDEQLLLDEISMPSTEINNVTLADDGGTVTLNFALPPRHRGAERGITFDGVRAYRHRAESHCTAWHVEAYDTLTEVRESAWVADLRGATPDDQRDLFPMHHYMIYLDSAGCYEVVAADWSFLTDASAADGAAG